MMRKILGIVFILLFGLTVKGICAGAGAGNPTIYYVGSATGVAVGSVTAINAFSINASTTYAVNIDDMKFWCNDNALVEVAISSQTSGGYNAVIATVRPIGVATANLFTSSCSVTCSTTTMAVGTSFRIAANQKCEFEEWGGKLQIPKGWSLVFRITADNDGKLFYGQFRVWE